MRSHCMIYVGVVAVHAGHVLAQAPVPGGPLAHARTAWRDYRVADAVIAWEQVLEASPGNEEARTAMAALTPAMALNTESLALIRRLLDAGHVTAAESALASWAPAFLSREDRAMRAVLEGRIALKRKCYPGAYAAGSAARELARSDGVRRQAMLVQARALCGDAATQSQGVALLEELVVGDGPWDGSRSRAAWVLLNQREGSTADRITACRQFLAKAAEPLLRMEAHLLLSGLLAIEDGGASRRVLAEQLAALRSANAPDAVRRCETALLDGAESLTEASTLDWLYEQLAQLPGGAAGSAIPRGELMARAARRRAAVERGPSALGAARAIPDLVDELITEHPLHERTRYWQALRAESWLMQGQLLMMASDNGQALQALAAAAAEYRGLLQDGDETAGKTLLRIGQLLASRDRSDAAARHYRLVAARLAAEPQGAEALWRLGVLYRDRLDQPLRAVSIFQRYSDLYPPSFRAPTDALSRIRQLGYADVARFQASHGLKVDGILGARTLDLLRTEESNFREILPTTKHAPPVQGRMVHRVIFDIARSLEDRGRTREAIHAHEAFLAMYPGHSLGDDSLMSIARIFKSNDLFREAAAAYERVMEDYPDGDQTSHAYIEGAYCYVCLGEWELAEELYELYGKQFPKYRSAGIAEQNLVACGKLIRYAGLVSERGVPGAKLADALYEMGRILYKDMGNRQKAVEVFLRVAGQHPRTYQAPDAAFSAGACLLHEQNYERARTVFSDLVKRHESSRLADDASYWIGHTYEYQARALGKLDRYAVTLHRRSAREVTRLHDDLALRLHYNADARSGSVPWHQPHPDVMKDCQAREQVRDDLRAAITAYRGVVEAYPLGDMAQKALLRIGHIHAEYLKDTDRAIAVYHELLEKYPGSTAAVDAQFAVGRHYLAEGEVAKAQEAITLFLTNFPNHGRAGDALLDLAECYRRHKAWLQALDCYQSYLNRYPGSDRAKEVAGEVAWIKKYRF